MARKPISQKREEIATRIAALEEQLAELEKVEIEKIGQIAKEAGLVGLDIPEQKLREAFKEIAARFQAPNKEAGKPSGAAAAE